MLAWWDAVFAHLQLKAIRWPLQHRLRCTIPLFLYLKLVFEHREEALGDSGQGRLAALPGLCHA
jgi:hypothetical protein